MLSSLPVTIIWLTHLITQKVVIKSLICVRRASLWFSRKESPCNAEAAGEACSILGPGRSPGGGHSNLLQYPFLENPVDRGAWWATVQEVAKSRARLTWLSMYARMCYTLFLTLACYHWMEWWKALTFKLFPYLTFMLNFKIIKRKFIITYNIYNANNILKHDMQ